MGIERIHWDVVSASSGESNPYAVLVAIWPNPVDHDACFQTAGFDEFRDSDETWDADWRELIGTAIDKLLGFGAAQVITSPQVRDHCGRALDLGILELLVLVSRDDQFAPVEVAFGDPPAVLLSAGEGHSILWLRTTAVLAGEMLSLLQDGPFPVSQRRLIWEPLIPERMQSLN